MSKVNVYVLYADYNGGVEEDIFIVHSKGCVEGETFDAYDKNMTGEEMINVVINELKISGIVAYAHKLGSL